MKTPSPLLAATLTILLAQASPAAEKPAAKGKPAPAAPAKAPAAPAAMPKVAEEKPAAEPKAAPLPATVAVVEGDEIKGAELEAAFTEMVARQGATADAVPADQRKEVLAMLLDNLIVSKLVEKRAAATKVPDEEVTATFDKIKARFGSDEELEKQAKLNGQTVDGLKEKIRGSLRQQHWVNDQVKESKPVTDAEVEDFYKKNPDQFKQPEQVRASHILIALPQDAKPEVVVEKEKVAQTAAKRVKGGEDFAKVAKELSEDPGSKETGGDLDFFTKDQMVPEFANAAFEMKKDAISDPVRSQFGYHIIKVTDRKVAEVTPLATVKPQLVAELQRQRRMEEVSKVLEEMRAKADVKVTLQ